jgi:hypothetical protein
LSASVRLLVHSGLPDPEWTLDGAELDILAARVRDSLPGPPSDSPPPWLLGYRGFTVRFEPPEHGLPSLLQVFRATLTVLDAVEPASVVDQGGVEPFLLDDARRRGHEGVLRALGVELPPAR